MCKIKYDPHRDHQINKGALKLRGLHSEGMTVKQLIQRLNLFDPELKVVMYDPLGDVYPVTFVLKDNSRQVAVI